MDIPKYRACTSITYRATKQACSRHCFLTQRNHVVLCILTQTLEMSAVVERFFWTLVNHRPTLWQDFSQSFLDLLLSYLPMAPSISLTRELVPDAVWGPTFNPPSHDPHCNKIPRCLVCTVKCEMLFSFCYYIESSEPSSLESIKFPILQKGKLVLLSGEEICLLSTGN